MSVSKLFRFDQKNYIRFTESFENQSIKSNAISKGENCSYLSIFLYLQYFLKSELSDVSEFCLVSDSD